MAESLATAVAVADHDFGYADGPQQPTPRGVRTERTEHLRIAGLHVAVQICGEGPPLLLLSGIFAELPLWRPLLPYLTGCRVIAFDPPGIGTTKPASMPMTMRGLASFSIEILDSLGIERADVLGASFGGAVAQQLAHSHRDRVRRLVLVSTSFGGFAVPASPAALWHFVQPSAYAPARLAKNAGAMFGGRLRTNPHLAGSLHFSRPSSIRNVLFRSFALWAWTSLPWLPSIFHPTLVIGGDDDPVTPLINLRVMARLMPRAQLHVVRGGGHLVLVDSPELVGPEIIEFLNAGER